MTHARSTRDATELTRRRQREQTRTGRRELEAVRAAHALRRTRLASLGVVIAVVLASIVVILVATGGSSGTTRILARSKAANETIARVTSLVGGIPQNGSVLGDPRAPVTLQYYADLECPVCQQFSTTGALPSIINKWVRPGKLKIEYVSMQTATREPEVFRAQQVAALAAGRQRKMWQFVELFYNEQGEEGSGYVTERYIQNLAQQVPGLNLASWAGDRQDQTLVSKLNADAQAASNAGFNGTPSFLVGRTDGALKQFEYTSLTDPSPFDAAIEQALKS
jgi:protein-disulfide isomerase